MAAAHDSLPSEWPVSYSTTHVPTRYDSVHVIVSGPDLSMLPSGRRVAGTSRWALSESPDVAILSTIATALFWDAFPALVPNKAGALAINVIVIGNWIDEWDWPADEVLDRAAR